MRNDTIQEIIDIFNRDYPTASGETDEFFHDVLNVLRNVKYEWVSVKDRLPEEGVNVLTYGARPFYDVFYINRLIDKDEWLYDGVTHWMSLPQPPEKE